MAAKDPLPAQVVLLEATQKILARYRPVCEDTAQFCDLHTELIVWKCSKCQLATIQFSAADNK